ncbi:hypothetical protein [uncultured Sphingomonas sp.]|uniref:hypothetical protein n=1 Tax=uncultured Sphingomonas sp. TaxID=158754 RepID=UPI0035CB64B7
MELSKTRQGYVVRVPDDVVKALGLKDGDTVELRGQPTVVRRVIDEKTRARAVEDLRKLAGLVPPGYQFDREEANAR